MKLLIVILSSFLLINVSFALWSNDSEVRFRLTISEPESGCECGSYDTILEGISMIRNCKYNKIYGKISTFQEELEDRIAEVEDLPFGGITFQELSEERTYYRSDVIMGFRACITKFRSSISELRDFFYDSTQEERNEVPDFWDQWNQLWEMGTQLDNMCDALDELVDDFWYAGEEKIDYG